MVTPLASRAGKAEEPERLSGQVHDPQRTWLERPPGVRIRSCCQGQPASFSPPLFLVPPILSYVVAFMHVC
jgi:hypothetical protein